MTKKIRLQTKIHIDDKNAPTSIKIDTVVPVNSDLDSTVDYYLITDNGDEIKGNYAYIIELYKILGGQIVKDKSSKINVKNNKIDTQQKIYKIFQNQFYSEFS